MDAGVNQSLVLQSLGAKPFDPKSGPNKGRIITEQEVRERISFEPVPDFVVCEPFERPHFNLPEYKIAPGFYTWLIDDQVRIRDHGPDYYHRYVEEVINLSTLNYIANIQITFEPEVNSLKIHHVRVIRKGETIELDIKDRFFIMRRERSFERLVLDGSWTLAVTLPDVRVGDIVDVAMTVSGDPTVFKGEVSIPMMLQGRSFWDKRRVRYVVAPEKALYLSPFAKGWIEPVVTDLATGDRDISFVGHDVPPAPFERHMPGWVLPVIGVFASSLNKWSQVADLMRQPFEGDEDYPEELLSVIKSIDEANADIKDKIVACVHYVQSTIRYFAFAYGEGGFVPRTLRQICLDRIGDCKDVSKLIVSMLRKLGVSAWPALVDFGRGHDLINIPPRIGAFNHAIACCELDGKFYWFEGTSSVPHYGDLDHMSQNDLGYALVLRPNSDLLRMVKDPPKLDYEVRETINLPKKLGETTKIDIEYIYRGSHADYVRTELEYQTLNSFIEDRCSLFSYMYGMNMCAIPEMTDNRTQNELVIKTEVITQDPWHRTQNLHEREFYSPESAFGYVLDEPQGPRRYPYSLGQTVESRLTTIIHTDHEIALPLEFKKWEFGGLKLYYKGEKRPDGAYQLTREYVVAREWLTPDEKRALDEKFDEIAPFDRLNIKVIDDELISWVSPFLLRTLLWAGVPVFALGFWILKSVFKF